MKLNEHDHHNAIGLETKLFTKTCTFWTKRIIDKLKNDLERLASIQTWIPQRDAHLVHKQADRLDVYDKGNVLKHVTRTELRAHEDSMRSPSITYFSQANSLLHAQYRVTNSDQTRMERSIHRMIFDAYVCTVCRDDSQKMLRMRGEAACRHTVRSNIPEAREDVTCVTVKVSSTRRLEDDEIAELIVQSIHELRTLLLATLGPILRTRKFIFEEARYCNA
jgi:hypothetical protein